MVLTAISILFIFSLIVLISSRFLTKPGYAWFFSIGGGFLAWILIILSYPKEAIIIRIMDWSRHALIFASPTFVLDNYSWPLAVAISTLLLSVLLTDITRIEESQSLTWSINLAFTGFGLLSILSANPLTFAMTWIILDIFDILTHFQQTRTPQQRNHVVISISGRVMGSMLMIPAMINSGNIDSNFDFSSISPQIAGYLFLAVWLRLGILTPKNIYLVDRLQRRGLGTLTNLIPVAASLALLTRVAIVGTRPEWSIALIIAALLTLILSGVAWAWLPKDLEGGSLWILGISTLVFVSSVSSNPIASQVWSISLVFSGGVMFLYTTRDRRLLWLPFLGILGFAALPFTPAWLGLSILSGDNYILWVILSFGLGNMIFGYLRFIMRPSILQEQQGRRIWFIYPAGLAILPVTHFWVIWALDGISVPTGGLLSLRWWVGLFVLVPTTIIYILTMRRSFWTDQHQRVYSNIVSLDWMYKGLGWINRILGGFLNYFLQILEEDGGVLWAVLIMILLLALLLSRIIGV